jgi:hypothetical protein
MKPDAPLRRVGERLKKRQEFLINVPQSGIVPKQGSVDLR